MDLFEKIVCPSNDTFDTNEKKIVIDTGAPQQRHEVY